MNVEGLRAELDRMGRADVIRSIEPLEGGLIAHVWRVVDDDGSEAVAKTQDEAADDTFELEVEGLRALATSGTVPVPEVLDHTPRVLLLESLTTRPDTDGAWERFGRDLAALHAGDVSERFGWPHDNWRGRIRQRNPWTEDGHEFFAQHRLLRYLEEPGAQRVLDATDRRAVEALCARLPEIVPSAPPVLTHGDLWTGNVLGTHDGRLAVIDPSVSYNWAEVDLALLNWARPAVPSVDRFFDAYQEVNPLADGWRERLPILALFELLSWVAHVGLVPLPDPAPIVDAIRATLRPFAAVGAA